MLQLIDVRHSAHIVTPQDEMTHEGPEPRTHVVVGIDGEEMTRAWCDTCGWYFMPSFKRSRRR